MGICLFDTPSIHHLLIPTTSVPTANPFTIMASTGNYWWMTPIQAVATLGAAVNFGGSALQSPLIMPMLQMPEVPAVHAGKMTAYLLHNSEHFFPPLNMLCTLSNLGLTVFCFLNRDSSRACALGIMVPMTRRMATLADNLNVNSAY